MKLLKQSNGTWRYHLNQNEAHILPGLLKKFPFTGTDHVKISRTHKGTEVGEREKLLNESLAQHRNELKKLAGNLLDKKFRKVEKGYLLTIDSGAREILLQILNDIRVGCWRALGEPENLDSEVHSSPNLAYRNLMDLAGYFEHSLLVPK